MYIAYKMDHVASDYELSLAAVNDRFLEQHKIAEQDILWVGSFDGQESISWTEFKKQAREIIIGAQTINNEENWNRVYYDFDLIRQDLVIVGKNFWLALRASTSLKGWIVNHFPVKKENAVQSLIIEE